MKFLIATNNAHKLKEIKDIIEPFGIECFSLKEAGIKSDPEETGKTFAENAYIKAESAMKLSGIPTVADDSGLCVDALSGAPGIYSSRYAGENATDSEKIEKLLFEMKKASDKKRNAQFVCSICCLFPSGEKLVAEGICEGKIAEEVICEGGFGYDPVFIENSTKKCFAEIEGAEKNRVSHRGIALREFKKVLAEYLKKNQ